MSAESESDRHNPFEDDDLLSEIASFQPRQAGSPKNRLNTDQVDAIAAARGFDDRAPVPRKPAKERLKPIQFKLPESEVEAFHEAAFAEFGPTHGAKTALFLKLWRAYKESNGIMI